MSSDTGQTPPASAEDEAAVLALYRQLLDAWNRRDAAAYAALCDDACYVVSFDGSSMTGPTEVEASLRQIFASHMTATYVAAVRGVRFLTADAALLFAVVGMVPPGAADINPAVNALQTLVTLQSGGTWRIVLFQNTPAQFHGRPEMSEALTAELRSLL